MDSASIGVRATVRCMPSRPRGRAALCSGDLPTPVREVYEANEFGCAPSTPRRNPRAASPTTPTACSTSARKGVGIWRLGAEPDDAADAKELIATVRPQEDAEAPATTSPHRLTADVEGLAVYAPPDAAPGAGYLIASSQGNWTYVVFDRVPPHAYRGTFRIADGPRIDGAGETDGIEVVATPVGPDYPRGMLVVQDGYNVDVTGQDEHQNFKVLSWGEVAEALALD